MLKEPRNAPRMRDQSGGLHLSDKQSLTSNESNGSSKTKPVTRHTAKQAMRSPLGPGESKKVTPQNRQALNVCN